jgi:hypothetical protein
MIPQEDEAVSPIADGKLWQPAHVIVCKKYGLVVDMRQSLVGYFLMKSHKGDIS